MMGGAVWEVKSWPVFFEAVLEGRKLHDLRTDERDYAVGDTLRLREFDPNVQMYSGREAVRRISYITSAGRPCALSGDGLKTGFVILSLHPA